MKESKRDLLAKGNIFKTVLVFSIPSIISMTVNALYNVVDKIYVGNYVSEIALGALQAVNPLTYLSFGFMVLFGLGASTYSSNKMGEGKKEESNNIFNFTLIQTVSVTLIISLLFFIFKEELVSFAGAKNEYLQDSIDYLSILIFGFVFQSLAYYFMMYIRTEGRPTYSMITQISGCIVNIVLDYVFIVLIGMGVKGAALATVIGNFVNMTIGLIYYLFNENRYFSFKIDKMFSFNSHSTNKVISIGLSSLVLNICTSSSIIIFNRVLGKYESSLQILAVLSSLETLIILPCVGIRQGILPVMGFNYGKRNYVRMFNVLKAACIFGISFGVVALIAVNINPKFFVSLFIKTDNITTIENASNILRYYFVGVVFISINMNVGALYQSSRENKKAIILNAMRQCLFLIPLIIIIDSIFNNGIKVFYAMPISDLLSSISSLFLFLYTYRYFKKQGYLSKRDKKEKERENIAS